MLRVATAAVLLSLLLAGCITPEVATGAGSFRAEAPQDGMLHASATDMATAPAIRIRDILPEAGWVLHRIPLASAARELSYTVTVKVEILHREDADRPRGFLLVQPPLLAAAGAPAVQDPILVVGNAERLEQRVVRTVHVTSDVPAEEAFVFLASDVPLRYEIRTAITDTVDTPPVVRGLGARIVDVARSTGPLPAGSVAVHVDDAPPGIHILALSQGAAVAFNATFANGVEVTDVGQASAVGLTHGPQGVLHGSFHHGGRGEAVAIAVDADLRALIPTAAPSTVFRAQAG